MEHYGNKLKMLRVEKGITQEVYAEMMNRSQNAVSSIERKQYLHKQLEKINLIRKDVLFEIADIIMKWAA